MKSVQRIKRKLMIIQQRKSQAFLSGDDLSYRNWCKAEKLLKWVLGEDVDLRYKKGSKIKTN